MAVLWQKVMIASALFFLWTPRVLCAQGQQDRPSLQGIRAMDIVVEELPSALVGIGLSASQLRTDTELKLRLAGIKVLTQEEGIKAAGSPFLHVTVGGIDRDGLVMYTVEVGLAQGVYLVRDPSIRYDVTALQATTWRTASYGVVGRDYALDAIRGVVKDQLDGFLNDWLTVNPR